VRVEKSAIKLALLIACQNRLSRPIKIRKPRQVLYKTGCDAQQELLRCLKNPFRSSCDLYVSLLELYLCLGV
jgi:hypothetical protein